MSGQHSQQVVRFRVGAFELALDVMKVQEVLQPMPVHVVPAQPAFLEGMVELRGAYVPLLDLRKRFGEEAGPSAKVVVALCGASPLGLLVDDVGEVVRIPEAQRSAPPIRCQLGEGEVVAYSWNDGDGPVLILDENALLRPHEQALIRQPGA